MYSIVCEHLHVSNMWFSTLEIGEAQPLFVTTATTAITPHRFFCVNRNPIWYDFGGGPKAICYYVKLTLTFTQFPDNSQFQAVLSIDEIEMNESEMMHSDSNT